MIAVSLKFQFTTSRTLLDAKDAAKGARNCITGRQRKFLEKMRRSYGRKIICAPHVTETGMVRLTLAATP